LKKGIFEGFGGVRGLNRAKKGVFRGLRGISPKRPKKA